MALETNAFTSYTAVGNVEDVSDIIYNIAPHETPFLSMVERTTAVNKKHEWQKDDLAAPSSDNAHLEGDTYSAAAITPTVREYNVCQISKKQPRVTGTQQAIKHYGRADEMDYQVTKLGKELRNDIEAAVLSANAMVVGDATTAPKTAGVETWLETNVSRGAGGASGGSGAAITDGTQRTFTEALLKNVLQSCWQEGGNPDCVLLGGYLKQIFSTFTGNATPFAKAEDKKIVAAAEIYVGDFQELKVVPSRHVRSRSVLTLQKDMWAVAYLRPIHTEDLAVTGDSKAKEIRAEYSLEARNEASSGIIADCLVG